MARNFSDVTIRLFKRFRKCHLVRKKYFSQYGVTNSHNVHTFLFFILYLILFRFTRKKNNFPAIFSMSLFRLSTYFDHSVAYVLNGKELKKNTQKNTQKTLGSESRENLSSGFPTTSDTNRAAQLQKMVRGL